jgi:type I restriction enzyme, S subunit
MIDGLKPYPAMKESGVFWLGSVPEHWDVQRLRNAADMRVSNVDKHTKDDEQPVRLCNYVDVYKNDFISPEMAFMRATATMGEIERFRLRAGDVLITKDSETWKDIGVPALVVATEDDIISGYHLALLRPLPGKVNGAYLFRALQSTPLAYQFHIEANGVTRYGLSHSAIKSVWVPLPPIPEQAAIVRFLDYFGRRIRRYIGAKRRLISLLNEQKQAIIHRAVTRGLDPNVRLKPSGVEWLGDVPEHWEVRRLKTLLHRIDQGISPQAEARLADDGAWGVLKAGCVNHGVFRDTEHKRLPDGFAIDEALAVRGGDVLVSRACGSPKLVGSVGQVRRLRYRLLLSDKTFRLVFSDLQLVDFAVSAMNSRYFRLQVEQAISGAEGLANNLPLTSLRDFLLVVPSSREAQQIASSLGGRLEQLSTFVESAEREVELMLEYRTRLIADVVTGKLDVREAAARLPDEGDAGDDIGGDVLEGDEPDDDAGLDTEAEEVEA